MAMVAHERKRVRYACSPEVPSRLAPALLHARERNVTLPRTACAARIRHSPKFAISREQQPCRKVAPSRIYTIRHIYGARIASNPHPARRGAFIFEDGEHGEKTGNQREERMG